MKARLNLATAPLENRRRLFVVALGVGLPALILLAVLVGAAYSDWRSTGERRAEVARLEADLREYGKKRAEVEKTFAAPETKRVLERAAFLNGLIEQRSFPWTKMFTDLERELPAGVHVVSLSPRMQGGGVEVHMVVGAASDKGKLDFLRTLENSAAFSRLLVVSETRPQRQEQPGDAVQLELVAQYAAAEGADKSGPEPSPKPAQTAPEKPEIKSSAKADMKPLGVRRLGVRPLGGRPQ